MSNNKRLCLWYKIPLISTQPKSCSLLTTSPLDNTKCIFQALIFASSASPTTEPEAVLSEILADLPASPTTDPEEVLSGIVEDLEDLATEIVATNAANPPTTSERRTWKKQKK
jgi:hypothetical protein